MKTSTTPSMPSIIYLLWHSYKNGAAENAHHSKIVKLSYTIKKEEKPVHLNRHPCFCSRELVFPCLGKTPFPSADSIFPLPGQNFLLGKITSYCDSGQLSREMMNRTGSSIPAHFNSHTFMRKLLPLSCSHASAFTSKNASISICIFTNIPDRCALCWLV